MPLEKIWEISQSSGVYSLLMVRQTHQPMDLTKIQQLCPQQRPCFNQVLVKLKTGSPSIVPQGRRSLVKGREEGRCASITAARQRGFTLRWEGGARGPMTAASPRQQQCAARQLGGVIASNGVWRATPTQAGHQPAPQTRPPASRKTGRYRHRCPQPGCGGFWSQERANVRRMLPPASLNQGAQQ